MTAPGCAGTGGLGDDAAGEADVNLERWTICLIRGHKWDKVPYVGHEDTGSFLRCGACSYERHNVGVSARGYMG